MYEGCSEIQQLDPGGPDQRQSIAVKLQGRDQVRVVGIVAPFAPLGVGNRGKFVLSSPRGEIGTGDLCRVPLAAVRHGRAYINIILIGLWVLLPPLPDWGSVPGDNSFYQAPGGKWAKVTCAGCP